MQLSRLLCVLLGALCAASLEGKKHHHACGHITRRQINETLENGTVVVSATVRSLFVDPTTGRPQTAKIRIRRTFKGKDILNGRREITVEGLSDVQKCRHQLLERDTKVFALNISSDGRMALSAPVLPITLNVLDALHSIVTNRPIKRRRLILTPCEENVCPFGSKCVPSTGQCECRSVCRIPGSPVCGSDEVTYASHCHLSVRACIMRKKGLELRVEKIGACEKKNPCDDLRCGPGEDCVVSQDNGILAAHCMCPQHCVNYGDSVSSSPVCSTHGMDYKSVCHLKQHACMTKLNITVKYYGQCDPCHNHQCASGTVCKVGEHRRPECRCSQQCPLHHEPVCASDGNTYENECVMRVAACKEDRQLAVYKKGKCKDIGNPCSAVSCWSGERCEIHPNGKAVCRCQESCPIVMKPVCGMDGITYDNSCELQRLSCINKRRNHVRHEGTCGVGVCSTFTGCRPPQVCVPNGDKPTCVCPQCGDELREVCGSDGRTYPNECKMRQTSCVTGKSVFVKYNGICEGCQKHADKCEFYSACVSDGRGNGKCECVTDCPKNQTITVKGKRGSYVCGTDGVTYSSECHLRKSACLQKKFIVVAFEGKCDACQNVECRYGEECRGGTCVCNYVCESEPPQSERVCGEDGVLYPSECHVQLASCKKGAPISQMPAAHCHSSGDEIKGTSFRCAPENCAFGGVCVDRSLCLCPMQCDPMPRSICGSDGNIYRNQCHLNLISCRDQRPIFVEPSVHRCVGNDSCQCNRIGSYGPSCDQSGQCRCRPGVGGAKCDHCLPNFWGIHLIARGAMSCRPCGCSAFGSARGDCEQSTGRCECLPGAVGNKCDQCREGWVLTPAGCKRAEEYRAPENCLDHRCHHGAKCVNQQDSLPDCVCPQKCDDTKMGIAANMSVCGSDGSTYDNVCQLTKFACKHQIDLRPVNLGICDTDESLAEQLDRQQRGKTLDNEENETRRFGQLGAKCTFQSECASTNAICRSRPGKEGVCACPDGTIERMGQCLDISEAPIPLNVQFKGREQAQWKNVENLQLHFNLTVTFNPTMSNGILLHAVGADGNEAILKIEHRRIVFEFGMETLHSRDVITLHDNVTVSVLWRSNVCTLTVGDGSITARIETQRESVVAMSLGGGMGNDPRGFSGCVTSLQLNGKPVSKAELDGSYGECECRNCKPNVSTTRITMETALGDLSTPSPSVQSVVKTVDFSANGYIEIPKVKLDVRNTVLIEIRLRPRSIDGLVFFWGAQKDGVSSGDFLALYLIASQPHFFWNLGSGIAYVKSSPILHHKWTTVRFGRNQRNGTIQMNDGFIASQMSLPKNTHLDISGESVFFGGVPTDQLLPAKLRPLNRTFEGALQFVSINERVMELGEKSFWNGEIEEFSGKPCSVSQCGNGVCVPRGDNYTCKCQKGYGGEKCEKETSLATPIKLDGNREIAYLNRITKSVESSMHSNYSITFKATSDSGVLLWEGPWSGKAEGDFLILYVKNGQLYLAINLGNDAHPKPVALKGVVNDRRWHTVDLERNQRKVMLKLDEHPPLAVHTTPGSSELNTNGCVYLGGRHSIPAAFPVRHFLQGCVKTLRMSGKSIDLRNDVIGLHIPEQC